MAMLEYVGPGSYQNTFDVLAMLGHNYVEIWQAMAILDHRYVGVCWNMTVGICWI